MSNVTKLADWPTTEDQVTVDRIRRSLLVWAKAFEHRMYRADIGQAMADVSAAWAGYATSGLLLARLNATDPAAALAEAHRYWRSLDDGMVLSEAVIDALDGIDPDLAEAVINAAIEETP